MARQEQQVDGVQMSPYKVVSSLTFTICLYSACALHCACDERANHRANLRGKGSKVSLPKSEGCASTKWITAYRRETTPVLSSPFCIPGSVAIDKQGWTH